MPDDEAGSANQQTAPVDSRRSAGRVALISLAMFGFGYALIPIYEKACDVFGINGRSSTTVTASAVTEQPDLNREVQVLFLGNLEAGMPWDFRPTVTSMKVHPGKLYDATYYAENRSGRAVAAQATPSVSPPEAGKHFRKTECFCFTRQEFGPQEGRDMPVRFIIDPELPKDVETVTLSYTFFELPEELDETAALSVTTLD